MLFFPSGFRTFTKKTRPTTHESISSVARPSHGGGHACRPKPDARLRNRVRYFQNRTAQRDHGREGRPGRPHHADRRRLGTHGRHGRHSPSRQYFPAQAAGSRLHRQRLRQNGRLHADQGIGKPRNPDRADQHARRGGRSGRADRLYALESRERRRQVGQRGWWERPTTER